MPSKQLQVIDLTGIEVIDDQHGQILDLIKELGDLTETLDHQHIATVVDQIVSLTINHFAFEEELMEQVDYPFLKVHRRLHDHFLQRLASYTQRFDAGEEVIAEMVAFMDKWLHNHFIQEDKDYSPQILAEISGQAEVPKKASNEHWLQRILGK